MMSKNFTEGDSDEYSEIVKKKPKVRQTQRKRRKGSSGIPIPVSRSSQSFLAREIFDKFGNGDPTVTSFQDIMDRVLPDYLQVRASIQEGKSELDAQGQLLRPPTRAEVSSLVSALANPQSAASVKTAIAVRKLKLNRERRRAQVPETNIQAPDTVTPLSLSSASLPPHPHVIDALYSIKTTPFASSFLSRLQGTKISVPSSAIAIDWESTTPWTNLMNDIRDHYVLSHSDRELPIEALAPIIYMPLENWHLGEVHDLLERVFWKGINVRDSLDHSPERCTIVACYKRLVVGVAILSSPRQTYITYLAVRAGWDNARIARSMLYHLIMLNPKKDITLHVSVNSSAMLLYNQFGFKAEEFVAGFYEDYLDPSSRASKNAFRLRLRQQ